MNGKLERIWKKAIAINFPEQKEKNRVKPQSD
jgi:hypothetical protein